MENSNCFELRTQTILDQRIKSLVRDGYIVLYGTRMVSYNFIKLVHLKNGNVITIKANHILDKMVQKTNGKITYEGPIQP